MWWEWSDIVEDEPSCHSEAPGEMNRLVGNLVSQTTAKTKAEERYLGMGQGVE